MGTPSAITERFAQMDAERKASEATMLEKQQASDAALAKQRVEFDASVGLIMGKFDDMARAALENQKKADERFIEFQTADQKAMMKAEAATAARFEQLMSANVAMLAMLNANATVAVSPATPVVNAGDHDSDDEPDAKQQRSSSR